MTAATPGPAPPVTPGQRAYEAYCAAVHLTGDGYAWDRIDRPARDRWEAIAQAVLDAARVPSLSINFDGEVTEERAAQIRKAMEAAIRPKPVARVLPAAAPELAEAMAETRRVRGVLAEVLREFDPSKGDGYRARVGQVKYKRWCATAGIVLHGADEDPAERAAAAARDDREAMVRDAREDPF